MINYLKDGGRAGIVLPDGSLTGDGVNKELEKATGDCSLHTIVTSKLSISTLCFSGYKSSVFTKKELQQKRFGIMNINYQRAKSI